MHKIEQMHPGLFLGNSRTGNVARSGQVSTTFVVLTVLLSLVTVSYWFADQYLRSVTASVWDAVETLNRAVQIVYGIPERATTITIYIPNHSTLTIKSSNDNLILEATGAFGDRRNRLLYDDDWRLINEGSTTLTADGKLRVTYGVKDKPVKLAGKPIVLGAGKHVIIVRNIGGTVIDFQPLEKGIPTEVLRR